MNRHYIAGLFDGEGSITITVNKQAARSKIGHYAIVVSLTLREEWVIDELVERWGGSKQVVKQVSENHSRYYRWQNSNGSVLNFLLEVGRSCRLKLEQVALAIELQEFKAARGFAPLTEDDADYYRSCKARMNEMNRKGVGK